MNRSAVFQAALQAALMGACASLMAFDATASGRMAAAMVPVDSTDAMVRAPAPAPHSDSPWVYLGPQRASVSRLVLAPPNPQRMVALLDRSGDDPLAAVFFESDSAGHAWMLDPQTGSGIADAAFDADTRALAAGSFGLWFREAGTPFWDVALHPEHGVGLITDRVAVATAPDAPVFVSGLVGGNNEVFRLSGDLSDWTRVTPSLPARIWPAELAVSDTDPGRIAVATLQQPATLRVWVSGNNGTSWTVRTLPVGFGSVSTLRWVGGQLFVGGLASASWRPELWSSSDNGITWQLTLAATASQHPHIDVTGDPARPGTLWVGTGEGVYRSTDGGQSFQAPVPGALPGVRPGVRRLVYEPGQGQLWVGRQHEGVWVSNDDGLTWAPRTERLGALPATDVAVNPLDPGEVASISTGIFNQVAQVAVSTNGGIDWTRNVAPAASQGRTVRFSPSGQLFATMTGWNDGTLSRRDQDGIWTLVGFTRPDGTELQVGDMNFGASEDTLLVAAQVYDPTLDTFTQQLWRSGDGGHNWAPVLEGATPTRFARIERTQGPHGLRLFVLEPSGQTTVPGHLWASDDDGLSWFDAMQTLPLSAQQAYCTGDSGQVLLMHRNSETTQLELYRSNDAGNSWTRTGWDPGDFFPGAPFGAMHCPRGASQVFLGGATGQLWLSTDGGETMHELLADDTTWGATTLHSIHLSPAGLYVAHRGGVWVNPDFVLPPAGPTDLSVARVASRLRHRATLTWQGGESRVDVRHGGTIVATVDNTGQWSGSVLVNVPAAAWQVCNAGTDECSAVVGDN